ncbi:MAG: cell division protein FtsK [Sphingopyxis sp.]|nr:MAG: cell division protein FtsK [Sphingopyxis sp.]
MTEHNPHFLQMSAETMGKSLLEGLIQEIRLMPDCWQKLSEAKQNDVIERLQKQVTHAVGRAVYMIEAADRKTAYGKLESVAVKDQVKAVLVIDTHSPCKHDLMDAVRQNCLIILGGADDYLEEMDQVKGEPDQNAMDLNGGDADLSEDGAWGPDMDAAEAEFIDMPAIGVEKFGGHTFGDVCRWITMTLTQLDAAKLQSRFAISLADAQRLILLLLDEGVIVIETEAEETADNTYKVVKGVKDIDINLE